MITSEAKRTRRGAYYKCETCGKEFYVFPSYIKRINAAGSTPKHCSTKCYIKVGANNPNYGKKLEGKELERVREWAKVNKFKQGNENPNFVRFGEEYGFKGSHRVWWRRKLIKEIAKCEKCGYSDIRALDLHHIDRDRSHNERVNLLLLCKNCHSITHLENKDGAYWMLKDINEN